MIKIIFKVTVKSILFYIFIPNFIIIVVMTVLYLYMYLNVRGGGIFLTILDFKPEICHFYIL